MADKILVRAINGKAKSEPFNVLDRLGKDLPKQFVLRIDERTSKVTGEPELVVGNYDLGLIGGHQVEYLTDKVTGYRRDFQGVTCIICERFNDELPTVAKLAKEETY